MPSLPDDLSNALDELDRLLETDSLRESDYQEWFEQHPAVWRVLGYRRVESHPRIISPVEGTFIPDFLAELPNGTWALFELKTPQTAILRSADRRATFYATFNQYVSQCLQYSEAIDDNAVRQEFLTRTNIQLQRRPPAIIVAGRSEGLNRTDVHRLTARYSPPLSHFTFDDVREHIVYNLVFDVPAGATLESAVKGDEAVGFGMHFILRPYKPPQPYLNNHIFDIGSDPDRDRVSVFINPEGYLRLVLYDSDGQRHDARSPTPIAPVDYGQPFLFYFAAGVRQDFGFMSVEIDGRSYAEIRVDRFRFQLTDRYALGTDISGAGNSWMAVYQLAILKHPLGAEQKEVLRRYAAARIAEIEANPDEKAIVFRGNQHLATAGHPSHNRSK